MATFHGQTVDIYENFEDTSLETGLSFTDSSGYGDLDSTTQYYAGSHSFQWDLNQAAGANPTYVSYEPADASVSWGFWYRTGSSFTNGKTCEICAVRNSSWTWLMEIADCQNWSAVRQIEDVRNSHTYLTGISDSTWYWITMSWVNGTGGKMRIYNTSHELQGEEYTWSSSSTDCAAIYFGPQYRYAQVGSYAYIDELVIDKTSATFPLLGWDTGTSVSVSAGLQVANAVQYNPTISVPVNDPITWTPHVSKVMVF